MFLCFAFFILLPLSVSPASHFILAVCILHKAKLENVLKQMIVIYLTCKEEGGGGILFNFIEYNQ